MNLKTATLLAIFGQIIAFTYWQCSSFLDLPQMIIDAHDGNYDDAQIWFKVINLTIGSISSGSLVLFLCTLYSKQK